MALPANPKDLYYGVFDGKGKNLLLEEQYKQEVVWQLSDDEPEYSPYSYEGRYDF